MTDPRLLLVVGGAVIVFLALRLRRGDRFATPAQRAETYRRWGKRCAYRWVVWHRCDGDRYDPFEIDHQIADKWWGRSDVDNFQPLCKHMNARKGSRFNWFFVFRRGIPVFGWVVYAFKWVRAGMRGLR